MPGFNAAEFFRSLTESNLFAREHGFRFEMVSDLEGFLDALASMQTSSPLVCVSDTSEGEISITNAPSTRRLKTVFLFMPHPISADWASRRLKCFEIMRELFRQFMSVLLKEITRIRLGGVYIDPQISFQEIDRYFFSGGACAFFTIAIDQNLSLVFNPQEWLTNPILNATYKTAGNSPKPSTIRSSKSGAHVSQNTGPSALGCSSDLPGKPLTRQ